MSLPSDQGGRRSPSESMASRAVPSVQIRVLSASNGACYRFNMYPNELTVSNIRRHLAGAIPAQDQILLLGPPYKVPKDSTLRSEEVLASLRLGDEEDVPCTQSVEEEVGSSSQQPPSSRRCSLSTTERSGARRLFLFSKQALSDTAPPPPTCTLEPMEIKLPTNPDPSPLIFDHSTSHPSPLHQALEVYERRFMLHLCQGKALADGADLRIAACRNCVAEQIVMERALRAAVANLSDHRNGATRTRTEFTSEFQAKTAEHASLLELFDRVLVELAEEALHPALVSIARASGRMMQTLLDTVPVEKSKEWANQCRKSHDRLQGLFNELNVSFKQLGSSTSREEEARADRNAEEEVETLFAEVERDAVEIRNRQAERLTRLTGDHGEVVRVIMDATAAASDQNQSVQAAFSTLEDMSKSSSDILPSMEKDDNLLADLMKRVADSKTRTMSRMQLRMRQISIAQSTIQRVLSSVSVIRDALAQQCENMIHIERVTELKTSYNDFISEIRRRRAYGSAVASTSNAMMERLASMRADEVKARERFLRGPGRHLMPAFFEIFVPTLATPPPLFTPQLPVMVEMDSLPNFGVSDASHVGAPTGKSSSVDVQTSPIHLNVDVSPPEIEDTDLAGDSEDPDQSLILGADNKNNDLLEECDEERIAAEAEKKTLVYENELLRQALERLGCKSPKTYLHEIAKDGTERNVDESQTSRDQISSMSKTIAKLEKDLKSAIGDADAARADLKKLKDSTQLCDKISHSSFNVGDVGLFMPTGRAGRTKKTYLAFHSNCPHRYLSPESIEGSPDYILGRIVYQEELLAGPKDTESNPFNLNVGTKFWLLTVEILQIP